MEELPGRGSDTASVNESWLPWAVCVLVCVLVCVWEIQ